MDAVINNTLTEQAQSASEQRIKLATESAIRNGYTATTSILNYIAGYVSRDNPELTKALGIIVHTIREN